MTDDKKYKIESRGGGVLPRCCSRWETRYEGLSFEEIKKRLGESDHFQLLNTRRTGDSTILEYLQPPHWNTEQWEAHRNHGISGSAPTNPNTKVQYKVTPALGISLTE